jgi:hypothetical protein
MSNRTPIQLPLPVEGATVEIPLSKGYAAIVDAVDADLSQLMWYAHGTLHYAMRHEGNGRMIMHRIILSRMLGRDLDSTELVDHINGMGWDNRRANLRLATHQENMRNSKRRKSNTSGYKGVSWDAERKKWIAGISVNHKYVFLGRYDTAEEAHKAYCSAAEEIQGEFARFE